MGAKFVKIRAERVADLEAFQLFIGQTIRQLVCGFPCDPAKPEDQAQCRENGCREQKEALAHAGRAVTRDR